MFGNNHKVIFFIVANLIFVFLFFTGCSKTIIRSKRYDEIMDIDTISKKNNSKLYLKEKDIIISILNNDRYLYIYFLPKSKNALKQIMKQGLYVWFDPKGNKKKVLGLKFPLGNKNLSRGGNQNIDHKSDDNIGKKIEIYKDENELVEIIPFVMLDSYGIELKTEFTNNFIYQLKIPIKKDIDHPFAINCEPGKEFSIGFVTPEIKLSDNKSKGTMDNMNISGKDRGGGKGGSKGQGGKTPNQTERPIAINKWINVILD
ncbi:MAG: hypothetical protein GQ534_09660 [Candidatus Delongbacteria bacterium]|nr:hypothetical protein [Candidatus Delongbacteria bacterium]